MKIADEPFAPADGGRTATERIAMACVDGGPVEGPIRDNMTVKPMTQRHKTAFADAGAAERLRHAIEPGATGDKTACPDPAAVPLGTDDEAAGTTLAAGGRAPVHPVQPPQRQSGLGAAWALVAFVLACVGGLVAWQFAAL